MQNKKTHSLHILSNKLTDKVFKDVELRELKIYAGTVPGQEYIKLSAFESELDNPSMFKEFVETCIEERSLFKFISKFTYNNHQTLNPYLPPNEEGFEIEKQVGIKIIRHK